MTDNNTHIRWISNTYDPKRQDADVYVARYFDETTEQAWQRHQRWLAGKVIGRPQATEKYTVEQLESWGMVGVYVAGEAGSALRDSEEVMGD